MDAAVSKYLDDNFEKVRLLKRSDKGEVWLASDQNGKLVIWKRIFYVGLPYVQLKEHNEVLLWPEIFYVAEDDRETIVVEEYISGNTLAEFVEKGEHISEEKALQILMQLCRGLAVLHGMGIIHRDIKPSNIIWQNGNVRLIDFDASRSIKEGAGEDTKLLGTKGYAPPEQFGYGQTDARSDLYSLGVTLQELLGDGYHGCLQNILKKCQKVDPEQRFQSADKLRVAVYYYRYKKLLLYGIAAGIMILAGMGWFFSQKGMVHIPMPSNPLQQENVEKSQDESEQDAAQEKMTTDVPGIPSAVNSNEDSNGKDEPTNQESFIDMEPSKSGRAGKHNGKVVSSISLNGEVWNTNHTVSISPDEWSDWEWRNNQYTGSTPLPDDWILRVRIENQSDAILEKPRVRINYKREDSSFYGASLSPGETENIEVPLNMYRVDSWNEFHLYIEADSSQEISRGFYDLVFNLADVGKYRQEHFYKAR